MLRHSLILGTLAVAPAALAAAAADPPTVYYSPDVAHTVDALPVLPTDAHRRTGDGPAQAGGLPANLTSLRGVKLDALGIRDGRFVFSLDVAASVGSIMIVPGDVVQCDDAACAKPTLLLDGLVDLPRNANVDAVAFDPDNGDLLYSLDADTTVDGTPFRASDVIRWNGATHELVFDGGARLPPGVDVDAIDMLPGQKLLFSVDVETLIAAGSAGVWWYTTNHDVRVYDTEVLGGIGVVLEWDYSPAGDDSAWAGVNMDAFHVAGAEGNDLIFADGFD